MTGISLKSPTSGIRISTRLFMISFSKFSKFIHASRLYRPFLLTFFIMDEHPVGQRTQTGWQRPP